MTRLSQIFAPESTLTHRERKILEFNTLINPATPNSRATKKRPSGGLPRDIVPRSSRSPEPPAQATRLSTHKRGPPIRPFGAFSDSLICRLASFLNPAAAVCLKVTCRRFKVLIKADRDALSRCEKWFVMACLEQDYIDRYPLQSSRQSLMRYRHSRDSDPPQFSSGPSIHLRDSRLFSTQHSSRTSRIDGFDGLTCALCKVKHGADTWGQSSPRFWPFTVHDLFKTKSIERICSWHFGKLVFPFQKAVPSSTSIPRWVSSMQEMCMHCGKVQIRETCHCLVQTSRAGAMNPECEICPLRKVRVYARLGTQEDFDTVGWRFCKEKKNAMFVREDRRGKDLLFVDT